MRFLTLIILLAITIACSGSAKTGDTSLSYTDPNYYATTTFKAPKPPSYIQYVNGSYILTVSENPSFSQFPYETTVSSVILTNGQYTVNSAYTTNYYLNGVLSFSVDNNNNRINYTNQNTVYNMRFGDSGTLYTAQSTNGSTVTANWQFDRYTDTLGNYKINTISNNSYLTQTFIVNTSGYIVSSTIILNVNGTAMTFYSNL